MCSARAVAMTAAPVTCSSDTSVAWLAQTMIERHIDSVPVIDREGKLVGLVTSTDLLSLLVDYEEGQLLPFHFRVRDGELAMSQAS